jgi:probable phosphoglycerate mutase
MTFRTPHEARLFLVRHGETDANVAGVWQGGQSDDPLNDRGQQQSAAVASYLADQGPIATVYTSPLRRARQTAEAIAQATGAPIVEVPDLREYDIGEMEGVTAEEVTHLWAAFVEKWRADPDVAPPGGESARQFAVRLHNALTDIIQAAAGQTVVVVSHQGALASGLAVLFSQLHRWKDYQMGNCGVTLLVCAGDEPPCVERFNVTEHLSDIGTEVWGGHRYL